MNDFQIYRCPVLSISKSVISYIIIKITPGRKTSVRSNLKCLLI